MNRLIPAVLVVLGAVAATCVPPRTAHAAAPVPLILENGLRVVLAPDPAAGAAEVAVWYASGTRWEREGQAGIAHLGERLMFRGSAAVPDGDHVRLLTAEGATVNTTATPDYTGFWETVPAEAVGMALHFEAARMGAMTLRPEVFEAERKAAREDVRTRLASAPAISAGLTRLNASVFAGHPYARPLTGRDEDLARLTVKDLETWRLEHYGPGAATLTVTGRFEPEAALALIRHEFGVLPRSSAPAAPVVREKPGTAERRDWARATAPARLVFAGWRAPGAGDPDVPALELLAELLGGRDDARLPRALRDEWKIAFAAQCGFELHREASMFWAVAALDDKADSSAAERQMLDAIGQLTREAPPGDEVDRARARLVTNGWFGLQTAHARSQALGDGLMTSGDAGAREKHLEAIAKLTPADLQRVAQRVFTESARSVVWLVPRGGAR